MEIKPAAVQTMELKRHEVKAAYNPLKADVIPHSVISSEVDI